MKSVKEFLHDTVTSRVFLLFKMNQVEGKGISPFVDTQVTHIICVSRRKM